MLNLQPIRSREFSTTPDLAQVFSVLGRFEAGIGNSKFKYSYEIDWTNVALGIEK